jgi:hypothetical protein
MKKKENEYEYKTLRNLRKGESIGLYSFFTGFNENMKIRTKEFCKMLSIKRSDFIKLLQEFPADYEMFCYIKDLLQYQSDFTKLGTACYSCGAKTHDFLQCKLIHKVVDAYKTIKVYNLVNEQQ